MCLYMYANTQSIEAVDQIMLVKYLIIFYVDKFIVRLIYLCTLC